MRVSVEDQPTPHPSESAAERGDVIYIADASVDGEQLASVLRSRGFTVVDVPFGLLEAHLFTTPPKVLVIDVDQPKAIALCERVIGSPIGRKIEVLCVGDPARAKDALGPDRPLAEGAFERPLDVTRIAARIAVIAAPAPVGHVARGTTPPPMYASVPPLQSASPGPPSDSAPPASEKEQDVDPLDVSSLLPSFEEGDVIGAPGALSPDLLAILRAAEERVLLEAEKYSAQGPVDEPDCRVPPEMLEPLEEPLDALEEAAGTGSGSEGTGSRQSPAWADGSSVAGVSSVAHGSSLTSSLSTVSPSNRPARPSEAAGAEGSRVGTSTDARFPKGTGVGDAARTGVGRLTAESERPRAPTGGDLAPPSAGFPFSTASPVSAPIVAAPSPQTLALRRELSILRAADLPPEEEAPVRLQRARPMGEGRGSVARDVEDRARTTEPPVAMPGPAFAASGTTNVGGTAIPVTPPNVTAPLPTLPLAADPRGAPAPFSQPMPLQAQAHAAVHTPHPGISPLGDSRPLSSNTLGELQRTLGVDRFPPALDAQPSRRPIEPTVRNAPLSVQSTAHPSNPSAPHASTQPAHALNPPTTTPGASPVSSTATPRTPITSGNTKGRLDSTPMPMVFGAFEGARPLATAVATRFSGSLALVVEGVARRVVFQDGDIVTAASERPEETLVAYLAERGDLERELVGRLQPRLPPSGRHAGAALIAQGHLAQDDLWPVLRSHAEWILCKALVEGPGGIEIEEEPPGRLKAEPSVFGGATGAEVFVELMRRAVPADFALSRLGGVNARLDQGARPQLLSECALPEGEQIVVRTAPSKRVGELVTETDGRLDSALATVLWSLVEMGVLVVHAAPRDLEEAPRPLVDPLDEEALRSKVRARLALVREGDYFSLLGVGRSATAYDIKRAYLELRRLYEPTRLLTASTADLLDDVRLIVEVLDEAFEILRDSNRRERYRRAIEAPPLA